jgi:anti-sigma B factor antagonist
MENLRVEKKDGGLVIRCEGEITLDGTPGLKRSIEDALGGGAVDAVVMDLSRVRFMDSAGIGFLVAMNTRVQNGGGSFYLYKPSQQVTKTLELVQLIDFFEFCATEDELSGLLS